MRMPFGKHRGVEIADLPSAYLEWLINLGDGLREPLRSAIWTEWEKRQRAKGVVRALPEPVVSAAQKIVACGYRRLALQRHPDKGGETEQMTNLNLAAEWLRDVVEQAA